MSIRTIVFDIGGILEITPDLGKTQKWEHILGLESGALGEKLGNAGWIEDGSLGRRNENELFTSLITATGMSQEQAEAFMQDVWIEYLGEPNVELIEYFKGLRPRYTTALLSNSFVGAREREEQRYQFSTLTDLIIYSYEVGLAKPDPQIFRLTCERLQIQPHEMIFLDDVETNTVAAQALGIHAVLFHDNAQAIAEIDRLLAS